MVRGYDPVFELMGHGATRSTRRTTDRAAAYRALVLTALLLAVLATAPATAQQRTLELSSVATADGFASPLINPAAPAFGNAGGIGALLGYDESAFGSIEDGDAPDFSLYLNSSLLSYAFETTADADRHTGTLSMALFGDLYAGASLSVPDLSFEDPTTRAGLLLRPLNVLSLGATGTFPEGGDPAFRIGGAVRPLFVNRELAQLLTVSTDVRYRDDDVLAPILGIDISPEDGLDIGAAWDFDSDRLQLQASVSYGRVRAGNGGSFNFDDGGPGAVAFAHVSTRDFRSFTPIRARTFAEFAPGPTIVEQPSAMLFGGFESIDPADTVAEVVNDIRRLSRNDAVAGILFNNHNLQASYANFLEIRQALEEFKSAGKQVVFYVEQTNTLNYALAAAVADEIYLNPQGSVMLSGLSSTRPYLRDFLDDFGVEVAHIRSAEYKTTGNIFSETAMPAEEREAIEALLDDQYGVLLDMIESGRGDRLSGPADEVVADGPYLVAERALEAGLVDDLIYADELESRLEELQRGARIAELSARDQIRYEWSRRPAPRVAVIYATGNIIRGESRPGQAIGSDTMAAAIREARENNGIDGIILRVSSGGGSTLGSAVIAREIELTTSGEDAKPVVVSMADSAASGGYYISAPADRIVAHPVTVTGSVGVVVLLPNIEGLSEEYGVNWDTVKTAETADFGALYRTLTPAERSLVQNSVDTQYDRFVSYVGEHRGMSTEDVERVAGGRVWSGEDALERGLVDRLGGLETSIDVMQELLESGVEPQIVEVFPGRSLFDAVRVGEWAEAQARNRLPAELRTLLDAQDELSRYGDEMILMLAALEAEED
ncbi:MAG: signal peptide peptidase SppA [Spirochaetaceae bacterium]